jgi:ABC-type sugar transport system substrate-binding protein
MKKKIKVVVITVLCMFMVVSLIGCATNTGTTSETPAKSNSATDSKTTEANSSQSSEAPAKKYKIGFIAGDIGHTFHIRVWKTVQVRAAELGMEVVVLDSKRDLATESSNVDTLLSMGVDAVMIMPCNMKGSVPAFNKVKEANLPVLAVVDQAEGIPYVGSDLVGGGGAEIAYDQLTMEFRQFIRN